MIGFEKTHSSAQSLRSRRKASCKTGYSRDSFTLASFSETKPVSESKEGPWTSSQLIQHAERPEQSRWVGALREISFTADQSQLAAVAEALRASNSPQLARVMMDSREPKAKELLCELVDDFIHPSAPERKTRESVCLTALRALQGCGDPHPRELEALRKVLDGQGALEDEARQLLVQLVSDHLGDDVVIRLLCDDLTKGGRLLPLHSAIQLICKRIDHPHVRRALAQYLRRSSCTQEELTQLTRVHCDKLEPEIAALLQEMEGKRAGAALRAACYGQLSVFFAGCAAKKEHWRAVAECEAERLHKLLSKLGARPQGPLLQCLRRLAKRSSDELSRRHATGGLGGSEESLSTLQKIACGQRPLETLSDHLWAQEPTVDQQVQAVRALGVLAQSSTEARVSLAHLVSSPEMAAQRTDGGDSISEIAARELQRIHSARIPVILELPLADGNPDTQHAVLLAVQETESPEILHQCVKLCESSDRRVRDLARRYVEKFTDENEEGEGHVRS